GPDNNNFHTDRRVPAVLGLSAAKKFIGNTFFNNGDSQARDDINSGAPRMSKTGPLLSKKAILSQLWRGVSPRMAQAFAHPSRAWQMQEQKTPSARGREHILQGENRNVKPIERALENRAWRAGTGTAGHFRTRLVSYSDNLRTRHALTKQQRNSREAAAESKEDYTFSFDEEDGRFRNEEVVDIDEGGGYIYYDRDADSDSTRSDLDRGHVDATASFTHFYHAHEEPDTGMGVSGNYEDERDHAFSLDHSSDHPPRGAIEAGP
ncbi:unnamed protein product, partial [Amoebophrya sp. A25]